MADQNKYTITEEIYEEKVVADDELQVITALKGIIQRLEAAVAAGDEVAVESADLSVVIGGRKVSLSYYNYR